MEKRFKKLTEYSVSHAHISSLILQKEHSDHSLAYSWLGQARFV